MTKLLSNIIKSHTVRYELGPTKTIKPQFNKDILKNLNVGKVNNDLTKEEEFIEGIDVVTVKTETSQSDVKERTKQIIEEAKKEAEKILEQAKIESENISKEAYEEAYKAGKKQGYEEVVVKMKVEEAKRKEEYDDIIKELEPTMVEIIGRLIQKITGILVEDREEVILHLIEKGFSGLDKSDEYILRVCSEDFEYVSSKKDDIIKAMGNEVNLLIQEDYSLKKNQCLIEDDLKTINCSLDVQLENLITNLKMLVSL